MEREPLTCGWSHAIVLVLVIGLGSIVSISNQGMQDNSPAPVVNVEQAK